MRALIVYFRTFEPLGETMTLRAAKVLLVLAWRCSYTLVVFNNITDYGSNYEFVTPRADDGLHFPGNRGMWRAINTPWLHTAFYLSIIAWEFVTMVLCWWGGVRLVSEFHAPDTEFQRSKTSCDRRTHGRPVAMGSLPSSAIGGEWFLMWQSQELEWPGCRLPKLCGRRNCSVAADPAGICRTILVCLYAPHFQILML